MTAARLRLGVDFGTSTTIAMLQRPDARVQPLLFDGSPLLSSAVLLGPDGQLHTGRDAAHLARSAPERLEPNPKRRIDDTSVLLGDAEVSVRDLILAVLNRVAREAARVAGPVQDLALTHPANWGQNRRAMLLDAARQAGFVNIELVGEPTAAATYFAHTRGGEFPLGACVLVYDLGAGTCDVTLLRRTRTGFEMVASDGLNDVGGLDVDASVIAFLQATYGELWTSPATRRQLWDDVRSAKEMLSRASGTVVGVPALGREVPLGREQLEGLTRPVLRSTISMTRALVKESGVATEAIAGLFLVGGSSRIPLVATMLHEAMGIAPVVAEQPELVVAEGSLYVNRMPTATGTGTVSAPVSAPIAAPVSGPVGAPVSSVPASGAPYPTTGNYAASPVSSPAYAPAPVSPAAGPYGPPQPVGGGYPVPQPAGYSAAPPAGYPAPPRPPQTFQRPMAPQMPAPAPKRGLSPVAVVGMVLAAVLVVGGGIVGATQLLGNKSDGGPSAAGTTGAAGATGTAGAAKNGGGGGGKAKYDLNKVPDDMCSKSDAGAFFAMFEGEISKPTAIRTPNATVNSASCAYSRSHALSDPAKQQTASISLNVFAYSDVSIAKSGQDQETATAKLAGPNTEVPNLGEEAIVYETPATGDAASRDLRITFAMRDSNVRLVEYFYASRIDGAGWSQKEKNDVRDNAVAAAKATFAMVSGGMKA